MATAMPLFLKKMKKIKASNVLFILGILLLLIPVLCNLYGNYKYKQAMESYQAEVKTEDYSALWAYADQYNQELLENPESQLSVSAVTKQELWENLNPKGNGLIGYIDIPKINVHLPIFQGTEEKYLQSGSGWWLGSSFPTDKLGTKSIITAHNGLIKAKMFTDIEKLDPGDSFQLTILDRVFEYEITGKQVTKPDDFEPLSISAADHSVILYTCTPYGINSHRLLITGEFVKERSIQ